MDDRLELADFSDEMVASRLEYSVSRAVFRRARRASVDSILRLSAESSDSICCLIMAMVPEPGEVIFVMVDWRAVFTW
jgi:hypothetical protein